MKELREFPRPTVLVSKCLEFENVRYNGRIVRSQIVRDLGTLVDFITVCPEMEIGLGVPRDPVRIIKTDGEYRLVQPKTGRDVTREMNDFTDGFMDGLTDVDGFILKSGSPTIGIREVKVYAGVKMSPVIERGTGLFAKKILAKYAGYPIEEDCRLRNYRIRRHFLTQLYTFADFRRVKVSAMVEELSEFNKRNSFLFSFYNDGVYRKMCKLVEQAESSEYENLIADYETLLKDLMRKPGNIESKVTVAGSIVSSFEDSMAKCEKEFFEDLLENYIEKRIDEDALTEVLRLLVLRYDAEHIGDYTILYPYPEVLRMPCDEKRDKDYWTE